MTILIPVTSPNMPVVTAILVIDNEAPIRELVRESLAGPRVTLREAADATEGWAEIQHRRPDVVLLDLVMPGMSGLELLEQIRAYAPTGDLPVFLLSARASSDDLARGQLAGATGYITKPFSPRKLLALLAPYLQ
ncbi:MAG: response regulator [Candidatus Sericytochromatia bacterium]|nr:response regulator [Candidatus Sericytochromatia bacterium]